MKIMATWTVPILINFNGVEIGAAPISASLQLIRIGTALISDHFFNENQVLYRIPLNLNVMRY
jgi:hypothetical protein